MVLRHSRNISLIICALLLSQAALAESTQSNFVGNAACVSCHESQVQGWTNSHHDLAMQEANEKTVLGDFDDATFVYEGVTTTFFRKGDEYWVKTDNENGELQDYRVAYVFGVYPLQQLLLPTHNDRLNALSIAWDARKLSEGGQRWYHIYEDQEPVTFESPLHWTGVYHNWNSRCAECHSTNVVKGYDGERRQYTTTFDQIDVGCEACHGPGSRHIELATGGKVDRSQSPLEMGLALSLAARGQWSRAPEDDIAHRVTPLTDQTQVDNCGRCHSRRATLGDYHYGQSLLDTHRLSTLDSPLYWNDGQILDEVYVYGSFLQSKMAKAGVVCSNCHDPHSNELVADGNAVCTQCHKPETYDAPTHHRHSVTSTGSACVACHMPSQVYMAVDARRDHSMRIPRPDISLSIGSPNACTQCHEDKTDTWAYDALQTWGVNDRFQDLNLAKARHSADRGDVSALPTLESLVADTSQSNLMRASIMEQLGNLGSRQLPSAAAMLLRSDSPVLRASAVRALRGVEPVQRYLMLRPFIKDTNLTVRMEVAQLLAGIPASELRPQDIAGLEPLFEEYLAIQNDHLDMPSVQLQLANFWVDRGDSTKAKAALDEALRLSPQLEPAIVNLVDILRRDGKNDEASALLSTAIERMPDSGSLWFSQGLHLIRLGQTDEALVSLKRAAELEDEGSRHRYVYAIALNDTGSGPEATSVLEKLNASLPGQPDVLNALLSFARDTGDRQRYERYRAQLVALMRATGQR